MAGRRRVLTWNMAYGLVSSYAGPSSARGESMARARCTPAADSGRIRGIPLSGYKCSARRPRRARRRLDVVANRDGTKTTRRRPASHRRFLARTSGHSLLAGAFDPTFNRRGALGGTHHGDRRRSAASWSCASPWAPTRARDRPPTSGPRRDTARDRARRETEPFWADSGTMVNGRSSSV